MNLFKDKKNLIIGIIAYSLVAVSLLFIVEQVLNIFIVYKIILKIILFVVIPILIIGKKRSLELISLKKKDKRKLSIIFSLIVGAVVLVAYFILEKTIDLGHIKESLEQQVGVNALIFPFIGFYIIFINSFMEEFFFRGVLFFHSFRKKVAKYIFNSFLFSIYHIGIFITWFAWYNFLLALFGLFAGGLIFSYVNEKNNSIINSYMIHISADIAVIIIGIIMFYF